MPKKKEKARELILKVKNRNYKHFISSKAQQQVLGCLVIMEVGTFGLTGREHDEPNSTFISKFLKVKQPTVAGVLMELLKIGAVKKGKRTKAQTYKVNWKFIVGLWAYLWRNEFELSPINTVKGFEKERDEVYSAIEKMKESEAFENLLKEYLGYFDDIIGDLEEGSVQRRGTILGRGHVFDFERVLVEYFAISLKKYEEIRGGFRSPMKEPELYSELSVLNRYAQRYSVIPINRLGYSIYHTIHGRSPGENIGEEDLFTLLKKGAPRKKEILKRRKR